jgi:hypothetical protein
VVGSWTGIATKSEFPNFTHDRPFMQHTFLTGFTYFPELQRDARHRVPPGQVTRYGVKFAAGVVVIVSGKEAERS